MNLTAFFKPIQLAQKLTRKFAKVFVWILALHVAILYLLATVADAPLTSLIGPVIRLIVAIGFMTLAPRLFDVALQRIAQANGRTN